MKNELRTKNELKYVKSLLTTNLFSWYIFIACIIISLLTFPAAYDLANEKGLGICDGHEWLTYFKFTVSIIATIICIIYHMRITIVVLTFLEDQVEPLVKNSQV
jgi:hypothetical protein